MKPFVKEKCHGQFSIQHEINNIIKNEYPGDWTKRIRSEQFREAVRAKLRQTNITWCDFRAGECACENES